MRNTTLLRKLIRVPRTVLERVHLLDDGNLEIEVRPRKRKPRCPKCSRPSPVYDRRKRRKWRHVSFGSVCVYLSYAPRRISCRRCDHVVNEQLPWAAPGTSFTFAFEELTAFVAQSSPLSFVSSLLGIAWVTVGRIVSRVVDRSLHDDRFQGLRRIGIDDFSYRKYHRYLTVVVDHDSGDIIWAGKGRRAESLQPFFELLGPAGCAAIEFVTMDMAVGYINAVTENLKNAEIVFDRFHVQQLCSKALEEVRRAIVREVKRSEKAKYVKNLRYLLWRHGSLLGLDDIDRLEKLQSTVRHLFRAYEKKEDLVAIYDERDPAEAEKMLDQWLGWASRSRQPEFIKLGRTIRKHKKSIVAYFQERLTNGVVEGLNNKIRVVARRAYGFHSAEALISMIYLVAAGVKPRPELPSPSLP